MRAPGFWAARKPTALARLLQPAGALYGAITARRMNRAGERVGAPVVCVGNFVAGGAGKTPAALALGRMLIADGRRVAFLSRGYGGARRAEPLKVDRAIHNAAMVGDEPLLLAAVAPCWVGPDRVLSANRAIEDGADVLLLDDGLQNPALAKTLAFAVVDGETGFGNGLCVPAGPLRAPLAAQAPMVGALIVVGGDDAARRNIAAALPGRPAFAASLEPDAVAAASLIGREVVAFAGIARPEKFYATLRRIGAQVVATRDFPDHHVFSQREIAALTEEAVRRRAILATTEKDRVRLAPQAARAVLTLPVTLRFEEPNRVRETLRGALR
ncbi:tetraacyldisaccharide 4'-kinase [Roseiarcus sp.]|uniref:tetraacyldisaccharide 4'-kinase n=1 Tax=Roseiarcus sp. TaxID=1969460 RepID=UPI003F978D73